MLSGDENGRAAGREHVFFPAALPLSGTGFPLLLLLLLLTPRVLIYPSDCCQLGLFLAAAPPPYWSSAAAAKKGLAVLVGQVCILSCLLQNRLQNGQVSVQLEAHVSVFYSSLANSPILNNRLSRLFQLCNPHSYPPSSVYFCPLRASVLARHCILFQSQPLTS